MSHKKRASTAFKSMGAAGLAAATIVSGLSFGLSPATALADGAGSPSMSTTAAGPTKLIFTNGSSYAAVTSYQMTQVGTKITTKSARSFSSLSAARDAAIPLYATARPGGGLHTWRFRVMFDVAGFWRPVEFL